VRNLRIITLLCGWVRQAIQPRGQGQKGGEGQNSKFNVTQHHALPERMMGKNLARWFFRGGIET